MILTCSWHRMGVPRSHQGRRFFKPLCPDCEAKREAGAVAASDPTPGELHKAHLSNPERRRVGEIKASVARKRL